MRVGAQQGGGRQQGFQQGGEPRGGAQRREDKHGGDQLAGAQDIQVHSGRAGNPSEQPEKFAASGGWDASLGPISVLNYPKLLRPYPKCTKNVVSINCNSLGNSELFVEGEIMPTGQWLG